MEVQKHCIPIITVNEENNNIKLSSIDQIVLPSRFLHYRHCQTSQYQRTDDFSGIAVEDVHMKDREKDLSIAIQWLRQEITQLKEQDKHLMRQFLDLRSTIHQLQQRQLGSIASGSISDVSLGDSMTSLDEQGDNRYRSPTGSGSLLRPKDAISVEFRGRTSSMHTPRKPSSLVNNNRSKESV